MILQQPGHCWKVAGHGFGRVGEIKTSFPPPARAGKGEEKWIWEEVNYSSE